MATGFDERFFIDHQNLRYLEHIAEGMDLERLYSEAARASANMKAAQRYGMTGYVLFARGFEPLIAYDFDATRKLFPSDHPHRKARELILPVVRNVVRFGSELGLKVIFHSNQFGFPDAVYETYGREIAGSARVCPGKEKTWQLFRGKIAEFFDAVPEVAGLQLTTSETQVSAASCDCPDCRGMSAPQRFARMAAEAWNVCRERGKILQFRTWGRIADAARANEYLETANAIPEGVVVSTKHTAGDFHLEEPASGLVGLGPREQVIEFDCWGEYSGWNQFPWCAADMLQDRLRMCAKKGVRQVAARINWNPPVNFIFEAPWGNEVNVHIFSALAKNPDKDSANSLDEWIYDRFSSRAHATIKKLYEMSAKAQTTWLSFDGENCNDHSRVYQKMGRPTYYERLWNQVGELVKRGADFSPSGLMKRRKAIDKACAETSGLLESLRGEIPDRWHSEMLRMAANQRSCAQMITDCLEIFGRMLDVDAGSPISDLWSLERGVHDHLGEWMARDRDNCRLMLGPNALEMLEELQGGRWQKRT